MILVTGATGFVGREVMVVAARRGLRVRGAARRMPKATVEGAEYVLGADLAPNSDWSLALADVDVVVHTAARVHVMHDKASDPVAEFRLLNVAGTVNLARQAASANVKRFVFLSSVKVNGEQGHYTEANPAAPKDGYGISKHEAEEALRALAKDTHMEVVIIRSPLVYGPGVRANFLALMRAVSRGIPLPLGAVKNRRSLVALSNLADFVFTCISHQAAANEMFLVSDGEDLSTPDLIRRLACAMGRPARLIAVPTSVLMVGATLLGKRDIIKRLVGSLQVDISKAQKVLAWVPPISVDEGLRRAVTSL